MSDKEQYVLQHPRKNSVIFAYPIDTIIDDMVVVGYKYSDSVKGIVLRCKCRKCGREKLMVKACLDTRKGTTHKACGQFTKIQNQRFYNIWCQMKTRTSNPNYHHFHRYGGRDLKNDYEVFVDFFDDMYLSYIEHCEIYGVENTEIDRINNDLGYIRGNVRWATRKEQIENSTVMSRPFIAISPLGEMFNGLNQTEFAKLHRLNAKQLNAVLSGRFQSTQGWQFFWQDEFSPERVTTRTRVRRCMVKLHTSKSTGP